MARRSTVGRPIEDSVTPESEGTITEWANALDFGGFEPIIKTIFSIDVSKEYFDLEKELEFSNPAAADFAILADALGRAEDNARRAHRLYANAVVSLSSFKMDVERLESSMRESALDELQVEKANGDRTKQITDGDVRSRMAALFPDETKRLAVRNAKVSETANHMERFADLWKIRCRTLQVLVEKSKH